MLKSVTFDVVGGQQITCSGCEEKIEGLLKRLRGVAQVRAKARNQRVEVLFDATKLEPNTIAKRLANAGYQTKLHTANSDAAN
jgi:copper chaperone